MDEPRIRLKSDSHVLHRLQIGSAGVIAVLLMVGLASLVLGGASDEASDDALAAKDGDQLLIDEEQPSEPLVDLGVVPDIAPDESLADPDKVLNENALPDLPDAPGVEGDPGQVPPKQQ